MKSWCEIDLRDLEGACRDADTTLRFGAATATAQAAKEGLREALARRRYKDRTGNLTGTAFARMLVFSGQNPEAIIQWPMRYASFVDDRRGFAGDAHTKAERVATREIELSLLRIQDLFLR